MVLADLQPSVLVVIQLYCVCVCSLSKVYLARDLTLFCVLTVLTSWPRVEWTFAVSQWTCSVAILPLKVVSPFRRYIHLLFKLPNIVH